jgi:hypothetical protein
MNPNRLGVTYQYASRPRIGLQNPRNNLSSLRDSTIDDNFHPIIFSSFLD